MLRKCLALLLSVSFIETHELSASMMFQRTDGRNGPCSPDAFAIQAVMAPTYIDGILLAGAHIKHYLVNRAYPDGNAPLKSLMPFRVSRHRWMGNLTAELAVLEFKKGVIYTGLKRQDLLQLLGPDEQLLRFHRFRLRHGGDAPMDGRISELTISDLSDGGLPLGATFIVKVDPRDTHILEIIPEQLNWVLFPLGAHRRATNTEQQVSSLLRRAALSLAPDDSGEEAFLARLNELSGGQVVVRFSDFKYPERTVFPGEKDAGGETRIVIQLQTALLLPGQETMLQLAILKAVTNIMTPQRGEEHTLPLFLLAAMEEVGLDAVIAVFETLLPGAGAMVNLLKDIAAGGPLQELVDEFVAGLPDDMRDLSLMPLDLDGKEPTDDRGPSRRKIVIWSTGIAAAGTAAAFLTRWLGSRDKKTASPPEQASPSPGADDHELTKAQAQQMILSHLAEKKDFLPEVKELLKRKMWPPPVDRSLRDYERAVATFKKLVADPDHIELAPPEAHFAFEVDPANNKFHVNPRMMKRALADADDTLFHEILHCDPKNVSRIAARKAYTDTLNENIDVLRRAVNLGDSGGFLKNEPLQAAAFGFLQESALSERRSWFGAMALVDLRSGDAGPILYLVQALAPYLSAANASLESFVAETSKPGSLLDPLARTLTAEYRFAQTYTRGRMTAEFERMLTLSIAGESQNLLALRALARLPPEKGGMKPSEDFLVWAQRILFSNSRDGQIRRGRTGSHRLSGAA